MICIIDYRTSLEEKKSLLKLGYEVIEVPKEPMLYPAIDGHSDIQFNIIDKKEKLVVVNKNIDIDFKKKLKEYDISYINSTNSLTSTYPGNIGLNAFISDNYLIHNFKFTDPSILNNSLSKNKTKIKINQGYAKCSILPISEKVIITNDTGIYKTLINENFDILLLPPGDIILPGLNYGFIGGVGGMITKNKMAFYGSLDNYVYGDQIISFLKKYDVEPIYLSNTKLMDRGSLFVL